MRGALVPTLALGLGCLAIGCGPEQYDPGPKVDSFVGKLTHKGKPVAFPSGETVTLQVIQAEKAQSFGVPIKGDGSFQIGWMPIGKYAAVLKREKPPAAKAGPSSYTVPGGFEIADGKTEYAIELGDGWKP